MSASDFLGGSADVVRLEVAGKEIAIAERYEVHRAVFSRQPCSFSVTFGHGGVAAEILRSVTPRDPFRLKIGDALQFTGAIDDFDAQGDENGTTVTMTGRDDLARLHDTFIDAEHAFSNVTYAQLLDKALRLAGYDDGFSIVFDAAAEKKIASGVNIPAPTADTGAATTVVASDAKAVRCKPGERWYERLKKEFDRGGLVLWAGTDNTFILSEPNANQAPLFRIVRTNKPGAPFDRNAVNVKRGSYRDATSQRFAYCDVYARGGGGKTGRTTASATARDEGMIAAGFDRRLVVRDHRSTTHDEAEKLARRKIADANRRALQLTYRVPGHTMPILNGGGRRAVFVPDTIVDIQDELLGISRLAYLESVVFGRDNGEGTWTELSFMRPEDLLFGDSE